MTNPKHCSLYTGVTSDLQARVFQHKEKLVPGFTSRYNVNVLVYYEELADAGILDCFGEEFRYLAKTKIFGAWHPKIAYPASCSFCW